MYCSATCALLPALLHTPLLSAVLFQLTFPRRMCQFGHQRLTFHFQSSNSKETSHLLFCLHLIFQPEVDLMRSHLCQAVQNKFAYCCGIHGIFLFLKARPKQILHNFVHMLYPHYLDLSSLLKFLPSCSLQHLPISMLITPKPLFPIIHHSILLFLSSSVPCLI